MPAPRVLTVIVNRSGGTASKLGDKLESQIRAAFTEAGAQSDASIDLRLVDAAELADAVREAPGETVAVGGGDGTLSSAAAVLSEQGRRLAVLPLGTLNHFAQAIGLDGTLEQAARVAFAGESLCVDLGAVEGKVFINNASLGLYPRMVRERERLPLPKWLATVPAAAKVLLSPRAQTMALSIDGVSKRVRTPLLFLGNNRYSLGTGQIGERESLTDGILSLYAVAPRTALGLILGALRILRGKADRQQDFVELADCHEVIVNRRGRHPVAMDGEVTQMQFPLKFTIRPKALTVMCPPEAGNSHKGEKIPLN